MSGIIFHHYQNSPFSEKIRLIFGFKKLAWKSVLIPPIMPTDYALDPVEGELMISTDTEFAVRRSDPQAGSVVVHFPRLGFQLKKA